VRELFTRLGHDHAYRGCVAHRDESMAQPSVRQRLTSSISDIYSRAIIAISLSRSEALASNYPE